jgi:tRNA C32,U32 (ribose-2'-O)-methylase TrmJ
MGSIFGQAIASGDVAETPAPRVALVAHGGEPLGEMTAPVTVCLGAERGGLTPEVLDACERRVTIPLRPAAAESLNVAAAAAIVLQRISSADEGRRRREAGARQETEAEGPGVEGRTT